MKLNLLILSSLYLLSFSLAEDLEDMIVKKEFYVRELRDNNFLEEFID